MTLRFPLNLTLPLCLLLVSCARRHLPPLKDSLALQKDCSILYQQFPVGEITTNTPDFDYEHSLGIREIPKDQWPASILALHPYMVCSYQGGIQIWIWLSEHQQEAYFIALNPELPPPEYSTSNRFTFETTKMKGIYQVKQQPWPAK